jgi:hypothetical protein
VRGQRHGRVVGDPVPRPELSGGLDHRMPTKRPEVAVQGLRVGSGADAGVLGACGLPKTAGVGRGPSRRQTM